jgi:hypothetical protein
MGQNCHVRLKSHGNRTMKLAFHGWADPHALKTRPVVSAYIDGRLFGATQALDTGLWGIESIVPGDVLGSRWVDLNITVSAVGFHWEDPPKLKTVLMNGLSWTEVGAPEAK